MHADTHTPWLEIPVRMKNVPEWREREKRNEKKKTPNINTLKMAIIQNVHKFNLNIAHFNVDDVEWIQSANESVHFTASKMCAFCFSANVYTSIFESIKWESKE